MRTLITNPNATVDGSTVFAANIVWYDPTAGSPLLGRNEVMSAYRAVASAARGGLPGFPTARRLLLGWYAGRDGGVFIDGWIGPYGWTQQKPGREWFQIGLRNGLWTSMYQLYARDALTKGFAAGIGRAQFSSKLLAEFPTLLGRYARTWSSGSPGAVSSLYARVAVRQDMVFGDAEKGRAAIRGLAARFFGWYPGARVHLVRPFGIGYPAKGGRTAMGAELRITTTSKDGGPCTIRAATFLQIKNGLITSERLYYNAASLKACDSK